MGPAPKPGHGRALYQLRAGHVLQLIKAMNAETVDSVGIGTQKILHMVNTNSPGRAANCRASICPIDKGLKLQAPSAATLCHIDTRCRGATKRVYKNLRIHGTISF